MAGGLFILSGKSFSLVKVAYRWVYDWIYWDGGESPPGGGSKARVAKKTKGERTLKKPKDQPQDRKFKLLGMELKMKMKPKEAEGGRGDDGKPGLDIHKKNKAGGGQCMKILQ